METNIGPGAKYPYVRSHDGLCLDGCPRQEGGASLPRPSDGDRWNVRRGAARTPTSMMVMGEMKDWDAADWGQ